MQELRFEGDVHFTIQVDEQVWLQRSIGGHELHVRAAIGVGQLAEAGKLLALEAELFGFALPPVNRARLARTTANLAYTPVVTVHRQDLVFPLTSLQLYAIEAGRSGDVAFEVELEATLPQGTGYPGTAKATAYISIAKSRWEEQLVQVAPSAAFEMAVPYPLHDSRRHEAGQALREAQRLITENEIRAAFGEVRRALEWIRDNVSWDHPGKKAAQQCNQTERWRRLLEALFSQASGALHNDTVTKDFVYTRAEAETLLTMTAGLLRIVPEQLP